MTALLETAELSAFVRTVDAGSLSRAARELEAPRATIGRRLARLEEQLGVRLLRRSTRKLLLTDAGEALYSHAQRALAAVQEAADSVQRKDNVVRGALRVSVPPLRSASFQQMINGFLTKYPLVHLQLHVASHHVDFGKQGFDAAIRATNVLDPGLTSRTLARVRTAAVASPAYLAKRGAPKRAKDLAQHACLMNFARGDTPNHYWPLLNGKTVRVTGPLTTGDLTIMAAAAESGLGIALLPTMIVEERVASGALVEVLRDTVGANTVVSIVYPDREFISPPLRAFIDEVVTWSKKGMLEGPLP